MKVKLTDRFCSHIKADQRVDYFDEITTGILASGTTIGVAVVYFVGLLRESGTSHGGRVSRGLGH